MSDPLAGSLWPALGASLASGAGSALIAALILRLPERQWQALVPYAVSFATGSLLGVTFLDLLPHLSHALPGHAAFAWVLGGILSLHLLERLALWRHCHETGCHLHINTRSRILLGDGLHNFMDGVALAAAFQLGAATGWTLALSIAAHEIPQEMGDLALLVESGMGRARAMGWNLVSSLSSLVGTALGFWAMHVATGLEPYFLALSTAAFLSLALSDLLPLHRTPAPWRRFLLQSLCLLAGVAMLASFSGHDH
jgi:zinc and cadmium transporter